VAPLTDDVLVHSDAAAAGPAAGDLSDGLDTLVVDLAAGWERRASGVLAAGWAGRDDDVLAAGDGFGAD